MDKCNILFGHLNFDLGMEPGPSSVSRYRHRNVPEVLRHEQNNPQALLNYWGTRKLKTELVYKPMFDQQVQKLILDDVIEPLAKWDGRQVNSTLFANQHPPFDEETPALIFKLKKPLRVGRFHTGSDTAHKGSWYKPIERNIDLQNYGVDQVRDNNALPLNSIPDHYSEIEFPAGEVVILGAIRPQFATEVAHSGGQAFFVPNGNSKGLQFYRPRNLEFADQKITQEFVQAKWVKLTVPYIDIDYKFQEYLVKIIESANVEDLRALETPLRARIKQYWSYLPPQTPETPYDAWSPLRKKQISNQLKSIEKLFNDKLKSFETSSL